MEYAEQDQVTIRVIGVDLGGQFGQPVVDLRLAEQDVADGWIESAYRPSADVVTTAIMPE